MVPRNREYLRLWKTYVVCESYWISRLENKRAGFAKRVYCRVAEFSLLNCDIYLLPSPFLFACIMPPVIARLAASMTDDAAEL